MTKKVEKIHKLSNSVSKNKMIKKMFFDEKQESSSVEKKITACIYAVHTVLLVVSDSQFWQV